MNHGHFQSTYNGLNSLSKKVYDAIPISTQWTIQKVSQELGRKGVMIDQRTLFRTVMTLGEYGLIKADAKSNTYIRTKVKQKPGPKPKDEEDIIVNATAVAPVIKTNTHAGVISTPTKPKSPMDVLGELAARTRALANDIEAAALSVAGQMERNDNDTKKLKQLQELLKSIGGN